ncbi:MAG TPA: ATP-binding protein [Thermomicrobiales bacterium]|jgi:anti-sigma regulatory factor (Ser/Thr protein kinase)
MPTRELLFRFPASLQYLTAVRHAVHAFCVDSLASEAFEEQVYQVQLAVSELATNIITHAYRDRPPGTVELRAQGVGNRVTLDFYDSGKAYQMKPATLPDLERLAEGGYGSYIIEQCVDHVAYDRTDGRNHWRLEKQFKEMRGE